MYFVRNWLAISSDIEANNPDTLHANGIGAVLMLERLPQKPQLPCLFLNVHNDTFVLPGTIGTGIDFIHEQRNWGRRILIADHTGTNSAAAFAIAAIKEKSGGTLTLIDAYRSVLRQHPLAQPHPAMWDSLCTYFGDEPSYDVLWFQLQTLVQQPAH